MTTAQQKAARKRMPPQTTKATAEVSETTALTWWKWNGVDGLVRGILLFFAATLPLYYDLAVPEVSGDIRWFATEFFAGLCGLLLLANAVVKGKTNLNLRGPVTFWFAAGLAIWVVVSMIDAINPSRGIILVKALYAQMILMTAVYAVATPAFCRRLLWAMVLPLAITSMIGIWQFHEIRDLELHQILDDSWLLFWLKPLVVWVLDPLGAFLADLKGWDNRNLGIAGFSASFFLQSAVPGSTFANKNLAGSWTAMMLPVVFYLLLTAKKWPAQAVASVLLGLGSVFLIYSRARASWVAIFAALLTFAALVIIVPAWRKAMLKHLDKSHIFWLLIPIFMVVKWGGAVSPVEGSYAIDRTPTQQVQALAESSWNEIGGRLAYNLNSTVITKDYWFNGVGLGNFYTIYPPYYDAIVVTPWNSYNVMARPQRTHTDMMQAFTETGVLGGLLYVGFFVSAITMALRLAGRRGGAVGGYLIGAGMMSAVCALTIFLEQRNMLALPWAWHVSLVAAMVLFVAAMLFGALRNARAVQNETESASDNQLCGLLAGISLLGISINALMDFPMQLPTAPAAAAMLMGIILFMHSRYNPTQMVGPRRTVHLGKAGVALAFVVLAAAWVIALWDGYKFREGNILLKAGMVRIYSGLTDDTTRQLLEDAYRTYPYDQRIQEHLGVVYANYTGNDPMSLDERITKLEWALSGDPWGANHMVNLAGLYLQRAEIAKRNGDMTTYNSYVGKAEGLFEKLKRNANFSHYTWGIGGTIRNMQGQYKDAIWMFQRSLSIEPNYLPAQYGLQVAVSESGIAPQQQVPQEIPTTNP
ncbi:MAG: hypothetical protein DI585_02920 [Pseudomonas fluorescens]|nr:MAG: hypothetical protein DI585_02920 [Pseudomonas fluorescens]